MRQLEGAGRRGKWVWQKVRASGRGWVEGEEEGGGSRRRWGRRGCEGEVDVRNDVRNAVRVEEWGSGGWLKGKKGKNNGGKNSINALRTWVLE